MLEWILGPLIFGSSHVGVSKIQGGAPQRTPQRYGSSPKRLQDGGKGGMGSYPEPLSTHSLPSQNRGRYFKAHPNKEETKRNPS